MLESPSRGSELGDVDGARGVRIELTEHDLDLQGQVREVDLALQVHNGTTRGKVRAGARRRGADTARLYTGISKAARASSEMRRAWGSAGRRARLGTLR